MTEREKVLEAFYNIVTKSKQNMFDLHASERTRYFTIVLENMFQLHNASAVMRSCDCFGVQDLHVIEDRNEYKVDREIAMGAGKWVNLHQYTSENATHECLSQLKSKGYKIIATTPHESNITIHDLDLSQKTALVFGTELEGLTQEALDFADGYVHLPMYGFTESFNVSVSAALTMHTVRQRLEESNLNWKLSKNEQIETKIEWCKNILRNGDGIEKEIIKKIRAKK